MRRNEYRVGGGDEVVTTSGFLCPCPAKLVTIAAVSIEKSFGQVDVRTGSTEQVDVRTELQEQVLLSICGKI